MHLPDGFLDPKVCLATGAVSAAAVGGALRCLRPEADPALAPRMGLTAAYVFAAQMVNFPIAGGTSGHLLGALLAAVLLGPLAASVVMAAVFLIQAFFFLDGGHTALGANVLNMGLAGTYGGFAIYRLLAGRAPGARRSLPAAAIAAWTSVMLGASLTAWELALSGAAAARTVFPAMLGIHALIGLGEAAITMAALGLLWRVRPDLLTGHQPATAGSGWSWAAGGGLAGVALLAPFAASSPDGLEWVAERLGFEARAAGPGLPGAFPDYQLPGFGEAAWAPAAISLIGAALMIGAVAGLVRLRRPGAHVSGAPALAQVDARVKLGALLGLVLTSVLVPAAEAGKLWLLLAVALLWAAAARVSARWLAGRALLLPLVGLAALSLPQVRTGGPGLAFYELAFLRAGVSLLATAALLGATPEPELLGALRAFRVPAVLCETMTFTARYLRLLGEETGRMLQARSCRAGDGGTLVLRAQSTGAIVGSLFIRSYERAERVSLAMAARGYRGGAVLAAAPPLSGLDRALGSGFALLILGVWLWR